MTIIPHLHSGEHGIEASIDGRYGNLHFILYGGIANVAFRYVYIPLGGAKRPILNMLLVFTFVAFWHDISLKLLLWGWLVTLFVLPEVGARYISSKAKVPFFN